MESVIRGKMCNLNTRVMRSMYRPGSALFSLLLWSRIVNIMLSRICTLDATQLLSTGYRQPQP